MSPEKRIYEQYEAFIPTVTSSRMLGKISKSHLKSLSSLDSHSK